MAQKPQLLTTSDYGMFIVSDDNRGVNLDTPKRRKLREIMKRDGFDPAKPLRVIRRGNRFVITAGQHRYHIALELKIPVWYVVVPENPNWDVSKDAGTEEPWRRLDHAQRWSKLGKEEYTRCLRFADEWGIKLSSAIILLGGSEFQPGQRAASFNDGLFKIESIERADRVAGVFKQFWLVNKKMNNRSLLIALLAVERIEDIDLEYLGKAAERHPDMLIHYGSRDGYLDMLEQLYNFRRGQKVPLKFMVLQNGNARRAGKKTAA